MTILATPSRTTPPPTSLPHTMPPSVCGMTPTKLLPPTPSSLRRQGVKPELYKIYNDGCVVDLVEEGMGKGGGDLCVELKVYSSLVGPQGASSPNETTKNSRIL